MICPFLQDSSDRIEWIQVDDLTLASHDRAGWRTYSWTMPDVAVHGIGIQLNDTGDSDFVVLIDAVSW
jgi:hypothetical protein